MGICIPICATHFSRHFSHLTSHVCVTPSSILSSRNSHSKSLFSRISFCIIPSTMIAFSIRITSLLCQHFYVSTFMSKLSHALLFLLLTCILYPVNSLSRTLFCSFLHAYCNFSLRVYLSIAYHSLSPLQSLFACVPLA